MPEPGQKTVIEYGAWRVTIEHLDVMNGNVDKLIEVIRSAFRANFGEVWEKEYFERNE
jgi:hypothetical protein